MVGAEAVGVAIHTVPDGCLAVMIDEAHEKQA
jgi:hypothetical protein